MSKLTDEQLNEIEARCEKATKGPWTFEKSCCGSSVWLDVVSGPHSDELFSGETMMPEHEVPPSSRAAVRVQQEQIEANLEFAAHARTDIPALIDSLKAARAEAGQLEYVAKLNKNEAEYQRGLAATLRRERDALREALAIAAMTKEWERGKQAAEAEKTKR